MIRLDVGRPFRQCHLDGCRAPGDEFGELAFSDAEEGFVDLLNEGNGVRSKVVGETEVR